MDKIKHFYGVDISKPFFDVVDHKGKDDQLANDSKGFESFLKNIKKESLVVMEATGYYHYRLAQYLYEKGITVSVVNPLSVKRFIQMKLSKVKTDKSDAKAICEYASVNEVPLYSARDKSQAEALQLLRLIDICTKQSTALKNKLHGEKVLGKQSKVVYHSLKSIPGIGNKTGIMLLVLTNGFTNFENGNQLCSYAGITPIIRQSGSTVRGKSRISKMGNPKLRNLLFMCSFTACKHN